jgi:hypothetical protein
MHGVVIHTICSDNVQPEGKPLRNSITMAILPD